MFQVNFTFDISAVTIISPPAQLGFGKTSVALDEKHLRGRLGKSVCCIFITREHSDLQLRNFSLVTHFGTDILGESGQKVKDQSEHF